MLSILLVPTVVFSFSFTNYAPVFLRGLFWVFSIVQLSGVRLSVFFFLLDGNYRCCGSSAEDDDSRNNYKYPCIA